MNTDALDLLIRIFKHGHWANLQLVDAARSLSAAQLDQPFDIGRGSLRKTLIHILAGETVWLSRWRSNSETPWPNEDEPVSLATLAEQFTVTSKEREKFLSAVSSNDFSRPVVYRDSKGTLFSATLRDMMTQMAMHSAHHRAQAVNIIRCLGGNPPELDYMMSIRKPA